MISQKDQTILKELTKKVTQEAKSVHEIIDMTIEGLKKIDVFISFDDYPSLFNHSISNSHNSPISDKYPSNFSKKPEFPTSYPGFSGIFRGNIVSKKQYNFGDLSRSLRYINTSSGTYGKNFNIGGMFFIYDFVHIEKEYRVNEGFKDISNNYRDVFKNLNKEYNSNFEKDLNDDNHYKKIKSFKEILASYQRNMKDHETKYRNEFKKDFDSKFSKVPPLPPQQFFDNQDMKIAFTRKFSQNKGIHPKLEKFYDALEKITKEMSEIVKNNPEFFI